MYGCVSAPDFLTNWQQLRGLFVSLFKISLALGSPFADFLFAIVCPQKKGENDTF